MKASSLNAPGEQVIAGFAPDVASRAADEAPPAKSELHTYDDGTSVVGVAPFPALSPRELAEVSGVEQAKKRGPGPLPLPDILPPLSPTSPVLQMGIDQLRYLAQKQLDAMIADAPAPGNELPEGPPPLPTHPDGKPPAIIDNELPPEVPPPPAK